MTILIRILTAALMFGMSGNPALAKSTNEANVLLAERQFSAAVATNDTRGIIGVTAEDWQIIDGDGHIIPRTAFLQLIADGTLKHSHLSNSNETVRLYGRTAVVTAYSKSIGTYDGSPFSTDEVSTGVWVLKDNQWRCVLTQLTSRKR